MCLYLYLYQLPFAYVTPRIDFSSWFLIGFGSSFIKMKRNSWIYDWATFCIYYVMMAVDWITRMLPKYVRIYYRIRSAAQFQKLTTEHWQYTSKSEDKEIYKEKYVRIIIILMHCTQIMNTKWKISHRRSKWNE